MEIMTGIPVSPGIAIGTARIIDAEEYRIRRRYIRKDETSIEIERWERAKERARNDLEALKNQVKSVVIQEEIALIFETHQRILDDPILNKEILDKIKLDRYSPEYAVIRAFRKVINAFRELKDAFFGQRVTDFMDIQKRLLMALAGGTQQSGDTDEIEDAYVIVSHDLTPSQTANFAQGQVAAFSTDLGGATSHTAILANALGIPAVIGLRNITSKVAGGEVIIIDGSRGRVIISPDDGTRKKYEALAIEYREREHQMVQSALELESRTADQVTLNYFANIEFEEEVKLAVRNGAAGLGLFRTEFIYARHRQPTEDNHYRSITRALQMLGGRSMMLRTLDFGADKFREEIGMEEEENPFLGNRSIRLCLQKPELFRPQLRAVLRAATQGDLRVMLPMIGSLEELRQAKEEIDFVKDDLKREGVAYKHDIKVGIMVEVPSAAMIVDQLAQEADFFSIGTNDLVQYLLAVDRNNPRVGHLYRHTHPAVLHVIKRIIDAGKNANIPVSVCGEMAGDPMLAVILLGMGLRSFSMAPASLPALKTCLSKVTVAAAEKMANHVLTLGCSEEIDDYLQQAISDELGREFAGGFGHKPRHKM